MSKLGHDNLYVCDLCGKTHIRRPGNIFKLVYKNRTLHFCGYNCHNKILTLIEDKKYDEVDELLNKEEQDDNSPSN